MYKKKTKLITETGSYAKSSYNGSSTTTCRTPEDNYITWDDSSMMGTGQCYKEASAQKRSLANPKKKVRVGCWNVRTLYSTGRTAQVMKEMRGYKIGKIRIFKSNVIAVLLHGCESWRMTKGDEAKLDTFQHKCLRRLLKIYWPMRVSNEEVRRRANTQTISELVRKRRWKWIGHMLRMDNSYLSRVALTLALEGKRERGRPKETWRRTAEKERMAMGFNSWAEAGLVATNRVSWRSMISDPILHN